MSEESEDSYIQWMYGDAGLPGGFGQFLAQANPFRWS